MYFVGGDDGIESQFKFVAICRTRWSQRCTRLLWRHQVCLLCCSLVCSVYLLHCCCSKGILLIYRWLRNVLKAIITLQLTCIFIFVVWLLFLNCVLLVVLDSKQICNEWLTTVNSTIQLVSKQINTVFAQTFFFKIYYME